MSYLPSILSNLNEPQTAAVTAAGGPIMILAGAGSGKTRVLTRRMAYLLDSGDVAPGEILAVTFTNKAAREMRERVVEILHLDVVTGQRLWVGTFHGMSARILRQNAEKMGYRPDFSILDTGDQDRLLRKILGHLQFSHVYWTPKRLINSFSRWKDAGLSPTDIGEEQVRFAHDRQQVVAIFKQYQEEMLNNNSMDFGDLLFNCLALWRRDPDILARYSHRFRHVLVDEYQDTNKVQYDWMKLLASGYGNLCVVGDDDQSIYSWRGARLDNILRFEEDYPTAQVIRLEQNYRSTGNILHAASQLINHNRGRMGKTLWTEGKKGPLLVQYTAEDGEDEARFVAAEMVRQCGGNFSQAAVLVRAARQTRAFEEAFNRQTIPYQVVGGLRFMERAEIKDAIAYLRLAYSYLDNMAFERIINSPKRKLGPSALAAIQVAADACQGSLLVGAKGVLQGKHLGPAACSRLAEFIEVIESAHELFGNGAQLEDVLDHLLVKSGYLDALEEVEREEEKRENLRELRSLLVQEDNVVEFLERVALDADPRDAHESVQPNRAVISTLHAAKGLEFPLVFLVGMEEGLLPHKLALDEGEGGLEEERRLTYVGMTRAREKLFLCYAKRRLLYNRFEPALPSRFIKEIPEEIMEKRALRVSVGAGVGQRRSRFRDH